MRQLPEAEALPDGSRVLHIGLPKTGTSTVQKALHAARVDLGQHGVVYAGSAKHSYSAAKSAVGQANQPWMPANADRMWDRLADEVRTSDARCTILSSEVLSSADSGQVAEIVARVGGDVQVVVTVRALAPIISSVWQEGLRRQQTRSYPEWLDEVFPASGGTPKHAAFWRRFDLEHHLRAWGSVVGEDRMTFIVPDPSDRSMLLRSFEHLLALPEGLLQRTGRDNESLPFPEAELLHLLAEASAPDVDRTAWARTVGGPWSKNRLKSIVPQLAPHPIRVPRGTAERANEATKPWIEAVLSSDASVVGDLQHLLVDPDTYPENTDVPETISIDSAAKIANVAYLSALRWRRRHEQAEQPEPVGLDSFDSRQLLGELRRRGLDRVRRRGR